MESPKFTTEYWEGFLSLLTLGSDLEVTAKHIVDTMKEYHQEKMDNPEKCICGRERYVVNYCNVCDNDE